ncbi:unnamed protein product [Amoebophrya sp. A25]|nr:unnamed protein product [Amoebophrya sp. A25]|eukprot:GSA25T00013483001.1
MIAEKPGLGAEGTSSSATDNAPHQNVGLIRSGLGGTSSRSASSESDAGGSSLVVSQRPSTKQMIDVSNWVEVIGLGCGQLKIFHCIGGVWLSDGAELLLLSALIRAVSLEWEFTASERGSVVGVVFIGVLIGNLLSGTIGDAIGRKPVPLLGFAMIFFFSLLSVFAWDFYSLVCTRFGVGVAFGIGQPSGISLANEMMPAHMRILLPCMATVYFVSGELFAIVLICFDDIDMQNLNWRWLILMGSLPSVLFFIYGLFTIPESPAWLQVRGRRLEAEKILQWLRLSNFTSRGTVLSRREDVASSIAALHDIDISLPEQLALKTKSTHAYVALPTAQPEQDLDSNSVAIAPGTMSSSAADYSLSPPTGGVFHSRSEVLNAVAGTSNEALADISEKDLSALQRLPKNSVWTMPIVLKDEPAPRIHSTSRAVSADVPLFSPTVAATTRNVLSATQTTAAESNNGPGTERGENAVLGSTLEDIGDTGGVDSGLANKSLTTTGQKKLMLAGSPLHADHAADIINTTVDVAEKEVESQSVFQRYATVVSPPYTLTTFFLIWSLFTCNVVFYGGLYVFPQVLADMGATLTIRPAFSLLFAALFEIVGSIFAFMVGTTVLRKAALGIWLSTGMFCILVFIAGAPALEVKPVGKIAPHGHSMIGKQRQKTVEPPIPMSISAARQVAELEGDSVVDDDEMENMTMADEDEREGVLDARAEGATATKSSDEYDDDEVEDVEERHRNNDEGSQFSSEDGDHEPDDHDSIIERAHDHLEDDGLGSNADVKSRVQRNKHGRSHQHEIPQDHQRTREDGRDENDQHGAGGRTTTGLHGHKTEKKIHAHNAAAKKQQSLLTFQSTGFGPALITMHEHEQRHRDNYKVHHSRVRRVEKSPARGFSLIQADEEENRDDENLEEIVFMSSSEEELSPELAEADELSRRAVVSERPERFLRSSKLSSKTRVEFEEAEGPSSSFLQVDLENEGKPKQLGSSDSESNRKRNSEHQQDQSNSQRGRTRVEVRMLRGHGGGHGHAQRQTVAKVDKRKHEDEHGKSGVVQLDSSASDQASASTNSQEGKVHSNHGHGRAAHAARASASGKDTSHDGVRFHMSVSTSKKLVDYDHDNAASLNFFGKKTKTSASGTERRTDAASTSSTEHVFKKTGKGGHRGSGSASYQPRKQRKTSEQQLHTSPESVRHKQAPHAPHGHGESRHKNFISSIAISTSSTSGSPTSSRTKRQDGMLNVDKDGLSSTHTHEERERHSLKNSSGQRSSKKVESSMFGVSVNEGRGKVSQEQSTTTSSVEEEEPSTSSTAEAVSSKPSTSRAQHHHQNSRNTTLFNPSISLADDSPHVKKSKSSSKTSSEQTEPSLEALSRPRRERTGRARRAAAARSRGETASTAQLHKLESRSGTRRRVEEISTMSAEAEEAEEIAASFAATHSKLLEVFMYIGLFGQKVCVIMGFSFATLYAMETYPTKVRATGTAVAVGSGRCGAIFAPLIYERLTEATGTHVLFFFFVVGLMFVNLLLLLFLPLRETSGLPLQDVDHFPSSGGTRMFFELFARKTPDGKPLPLASDVEDEDRRQRELPPPPIM